MNKLKIRLEANRSNVNCCVYGCNSVSKKNPGLSFHSFPPENQITSYKDEFGNFVETNRRKMWCVRLKIVRPASDYMRVCSKHFLEEDYITPAGGDYGKRFLRKNAIPTQNLPMTATIVNDFEEKRKQNKLIKRGKLYILTDETNLGKSDHLLLSDGMPTSYKYCLVPKCKNTTNTTPEKYFFPVPRDKKLRKEWCIAMKRNDSELSSKTSLRCCEDHFDIKTDVENYVKYSLVGGKMTLKKGVLPHKFDCQTEFLKTVSASFETPLFEFVSCGINASEL